MSAQLLKEIREAFDGDDVPKKNRTLRLAYNRIEMLEGLLVDYEDPLRRCDGCGGNRKVGDHSKCGTLTFEGSLVR